MPRLGTLSTVLLFTAIACASPQASSTLATAEMPRTVLYTHTMLKAEPGQVDRLIAFIEANWFAMDQVGVERGIFTSYGLLRPTEPNADWDLIVVVGYPQAAGYGDPETQRSFAAIRAEHETITIEGRGLPELGRVVGSRELEVVSTRP